MEYDRVLRGAREHLYVEELLTVEHPPLRAIRGPILTACL